MNQRDANKAVVLSTLAKLNATQKEKELTVFTAFAESDFDNKANDRNQTFGVFQQDPRWWGTKEQILDIPQATTRFLTALKKVPPRTDPVAYVWQVQNWTGDLPTNMSSPFTNSTTAAVWEADPRTKNYRRRVPDIQELVSNPNFFKDRKIV